MDFILSCTKFLRNNFLFIIKKLNGPNVDFFQNSLVFYALSSEPCRGGAKKA